MNHNVTIGIVAIVAAMALTGVAFAVPQQALAGGHHNNHKNSIKVDQQVNQQNNCSGPNLIPMPRLEVTAPQLSTVCENFGDNSADIHK